MADGPERLFRKYLNTASHTEQTMQTKLACHLAIPMPAIEMLEDSNRKGFAREALYSTLDEFCNGSGNFPFPMENCIVYPTVNLLEEDDRERLTRGKRVPHRIAKECEILSVSVTIDLSIFEATVAECEDKKANKEHLCQMLAYIHFTKLVSDLLIIANVARPGSIGLRYSWIVQDSHRRKRSNAIPVMQEYALQQAVAVADKMRWPSLEPLDLVTTWQWAVGHYGTLDPFYGGTTGRAFTAFGRLFEDKTSDEPMQLLWALVGIESLYGQGNSDLFRQIREKSQLFLGPQVDFKKKLGEMYNFRSRFVHGDLPFPGLYVIHDADEKLAGYDEDLLEATAVAIAVLAGTLQEIIRRNWSGLDFDISVRDSATKDMPQSINGNMN